MDNNTVEFAVSGNYALFTEPWSVMGGAKTTYPIPTYEAIKGILKNVYWKPTITWYIDEIRVMNPIMSEYRGVKTRHYNTNFGVANLSYYYYLTDVKYQVKAHFEWNYNNDQFSEDRDPAKHASIARRSIAMGGRRRTYLGTTECPCYIEPCVYGEGEGYYDNKGSIPLGYSFLGFIYPDENRDPELKKDKLYKCFYNPVMNNGVIKFPTPESCEVKQETVTMKPKVFENK